MLFLLAVTFLLTAPNGLNAQSRKLLSSRFLAYAVEQDGKWGLEVDGVEVLPPTYASITYMRNDDNIFVVRNEEGRLGGINLRGEVVIPFATYTKIISMPSYDLIHAHYEIANTPRAFNRGTMYAAGLTDEIVHSSDKTVWGYTLGEGSGVWKRRMPESNKWGFYTDEGRKIDEFETIDPYEACPMWGGYRFYVVTREGKKGMIMYRDGEYQESIDIRYDDLVKAENKNRSFSGIPRAVWVNDAAGSEILYIDGQPAVGTVAHTAPKTRAEQERLRNQTVRYEVSVAKTRKSGTRINYIEKAYDYTEVGFTYEEKSAEGTPATYGPDHRNAYYIKAGDNVYKLIWIVKELPNMTKRGQKFDYILRFEPLPAEVSSFDIIEGEGGQAHFYGVNLIINQ